MVAAGQSNGRWTSNSRNTTEAILAALPLRTTTENKVTATEAANDKGILERKWKETRGSKLMFGRQGGIGIGVVAGYKGSSRGTKKRCERKDSSNRRKRLRKAQNGDEPWDCSSTRPTAPLGGNEPMAQEDENMQASAWHEDESVRWKHGQP
jgi:hypothetical protein